MRESGLPIDGVLPELRAALGSHRNVVLQAPPGAGKSTVVPLALLDEPWARGKRLIMLEPRRLASRAVAQRMAQTLRENVGQTVGYRMRLDTRVSRDTRIEVVTEGVLTRMLQNDPSLEGVAAVIFDEFHERSLQADLGLALAIDARENLAPDLKLLMMSATLDGQRVAALLGDAPIVTAEGRMFPVETRFVGKGAPVLPDSTAPRGQVESPERLVAQIVLGALAEEPGDVLVFLPGAREIRRVQAMLEERMAGTASEAGASLRSRGAEQSAGHAARLPPHSIRVFPLFGELSAGDQDAALTPSAPGMRKVVLSTNIAETSLTIQGVRVVVDSGLVRRSVFDPATGMSRLETQRISRASADQRQGRAGRVEPGVCYRAWSEGAQRSLAPFSAPEIMDADLAPLALDLANWGARDAGDLRWLDPPPAAMLASARDLLARLGALDAQGRITPHGQEMAQLGVHPRLAHMLLRARALGDVEMAADFAALLSERDLLRGAPGSRDADIRSRLDALRSDRAPPGVDRGTFDRARRISRDLYQRLAPSRAQGSRADAASARASPRANQASGGVDAGDQRDGGGARGADADDRASARASPRPARGVSTGEGDGQSRGGGAHSADADDRASARASPRPARGVSAGEGDGQSRGSRAQSADAGLLLAFAYPDRIGRRRSGDEARYTLANGRGAHFADTQSLGRQELIVAVDLDDRERDARIFLAAPLSRQSVEQHLADRLQRADVVEWNSREQAVTARRMLRLDSLVLDEQPLPQLPADATRAAMLTGIREMGLAVLPWSRDARDLQARMEFARRAIQPPPAASDPTTDDARSPPGRVARPATPRASDKAAGDIASRPDTSMTAHGENWPSVSDDALIASLDTWLAPWLDGITRRDHLSRISIAETLRALLTWDQQRRLDELAPSHLEVPTGSRIRIDYLDESAPVVSVRLQEVFGLEETPRIGGGRVPITFKLLSPAQRPVQVTRDLAGFWRGSYADVRKDMRGRYPKHYWPENPLEAEPTRGVRRKPRVP